MNREIKELKGLIIGCGSIGERHLYNLTRLGLKKLAIFDIDKKRVSELSSKYKTSKFFDLNSALSFEPNFSFICTYPNTHLPIMKSCIKANSHVFVEKPISSNDSGIKNLLHKADSKKLKIGVGYNNRLEHGLQLVKKTLKKSEIGTPLAISVQWGNNIKFWRRGLDYKNHYVLKKGGGIILDDSHEYDYVRWLLDDDVKTVYSQTQKIPLLKTETESIASFILRFKKGTIASFMIDYVRPRYERSCQIIGEKGGLRWEYHPGNRGWKKYDSPSYSKVILNLINKNKSRITEFRKKSNDMYVEEIKEFLYSIINNKKPVVDGWEGLRTLKLGMAILKSAKENRIISL